MQPRRSPASSNNQEKNLARAVHENLFPKGERDAEKRNFELNRGLLLKLELRSNPNLLCVIRGAVERLTEVFGFSAPERRSVTRAVDEALCNVMRHAYCGRLNKPITVYFRRVQRRSKGLLNEGLEVLLWDRGPAIDTAKLCGRKLDEIRPGGLGLHFIRQAMDTVEFTRVGRMNQLRLVKYLQPAKLDPNS
jgi:anti-sigma regulatory factor (Ser/Thr protein kinase)